MSTLHGVHTESSPLPASDVEGLRARLLGAAIEPGDSNYHAARAVWNAMIDRHPALIVTCRCTADVIEGVRFARQHARPIAIRGGGHNVAGHAVGEGSVMLDLSAMRAVRVDPEARRAWVQGGATWRDVDAETQAFGLALPGGLISDTGVAGLTLSGGVGWLRSRFGLTIDNLVAADVITADGSPLHASTTEHSDLLWALKGGGGNFGVVSWFEFALHSIPPRLMFCAPLYPVSAGSGPIRFWRDFLADKSDDVASLVEFSTIPNDPTYPREFWGQRIYTIAAVYAGDADEGERILQPLRECGELVADFSAQLPYCDIQRLFDTVIPFHEYRCYWKSHLLAGLEDSTIDAILDANRQPPSPYTLSSIWNFGGATARVDADATAFGDRTMNAMLSIDSIWQDTAGDATNIEWTRAFWQRMLPYSQRGRIYLNFPGLGEDGDSLVRSSFGDNLQRLARIKHQYDPDNVFRFNQNIPLD